MGTVVASSCSCRKAIESQMIGETEKITNRTRAESTSDSSNCKYFNSLLPVDYDDNGETLDDEIIDEFYHAIQDGNLGKVRALLDEHPNIPFFRTRYHSQITCLHHAVQQKAHSVLDYLISVPRAQKLLDEPTNDCYGDSPLIISARLGDTRSLATLHKSGANKQFRNKQHMNAIHIAIQRRDNKALRALGELFDDDDGGSTFGRHPPPKKQKSVSFKSKVHTVSPEPDLPESPDSGRPTVFAMDILNAANSDDKHGSLSPPDQSQIPRVSNGTYIKRMDTTMLNDIADDALFTMQTTIRMDRTKQMVLEAWLDKKQQAPPWGFHTRWCIVSGRYMMWSEVKIKIGEHGMTQRERKRWNKCINLFLVTSVTPLSGKNNRRFQITIQEHHHHHQHHHKKKKNGQRRKSKLFIRNYVFRAKSKKWRDKWVGGLRKHIEQIQREKTFMKQSESKFIDLDSR